MSNRRFPFSGSGSGERLKFYPNMKAIIAEKPSVGMDIARVVGATDKKDGYCTGNGYMVTWALGHLVSLAMPGAYGYTKTSAENLPMLPDPFRLVSRQVRTDKGMVTDIAAAKQLKIIDSVFDRCDSIIVATDCAREGELIFRWIYSYLGYTKPFKRLWISSLTDEAIREGLANLRDGSDYDSLYAAADCRAKADWLVGMNASRALAVASGSANNSIGRVQTPTLAMVCARFKENRNFVSTPYWQLHLTLKRQDAHRMFIHTEEFKEKDAAEAAYRKITSGSVATVTGSEHKRTFQQAPLLYDLTTLQKDCNVHYDLTAEKTLSIAQSLYEKKLISYPRTGSRHIPEDVMRHIPSLLGKVVSMPEFREYGQSFDMSDLNTRSVDDTKVTDHHALIITGISPEGLSEAESTVYTLIAGRMLEAFSPPCEKELLVMECACEGMAFRSRSSSIVRPGWRGVFARKEDREKDEPERDGGSTFRVTLPLKTTDETVESENLIIPHPAHLPRNVLVIDDDTMLLNVIKEMLERNGMNCTTCVTSKDVVKAMRGKDYDLLLSDIQMPGTNGIDLLTLLRNSNIGNSRTIPIVAMTARGDRDKEAFLHAGFTDYIYKPFSSSELLGLLSRMKTDRREKKPEVDFSLVLSEVNDKHKALLSLISQSEKDREELDAAMKNGDRHKLREITHRMQPMWEFLRMEEPLLAYRALLKDSKTSDKELKEYTRQIIDSTAMLIKAAEAEIKRLTNETEDTDS